MLCHLFSFHSHNSVLRACFIFSERVTHSRFSALLLSLILSLWLVSSHVSYQWNAIHTSLCESYSFQYIDTRKYQSLEYLCLQSECLFLILHSELAWIQYIDGTSFQISSIFILLQKLPSVVETEGSKCFCSCCVLHSMVSTWQSEDYNLRCKSII